MREPDVSGADSRRPTADDLCYQFCHSLCFLAGILLDGLHNGGADRGSISKVANRGKMLRPGNAKSDSHRQLRKLAQPLDQLEGRVGQHAQVGEDDRVRRPLSATG